MKCAFTDHHNPEVMKDDIMTSWMERIRKLVIPFEDDYSYKQAIAKLAMRVEVRPDWYNYRTGGSWVSKEYRITLDENHRICGEFDEYGVPSEVRFEYLDDDFWIPCFLEFDERNDLFTFVSQVYYE
jgi:hypothetical protein